MKKRYRTVSVFSFFLVATGILMGGNAKVPVKIRENTSYFYVNQNGQKIKVGRIQDMANRLTDDFTKTSRTCPPYCIQPIRVARGVQTIGELELITAIKDPKVLLVDARPKSWFVLESLPGAVNIPEKVTANPKARDKLLKILGSKVLVVYGNGSWSPEAAQFIRNMIRLGFPPAKLRYYRDGLQGWKLLGMTTVIHQKHQVQ